MRYEEEGREPSRDDEMNQELGTTSVTHLSRTSRRAANRVRPFRADISVALWRIRIDALSRWQPANFAISINDVHWGQHPNKRSLFGGLLSFKHYVAVNYIHDSGTFVGFTGIQFDVSS